MVLEDEFSLKVEFLSSFFKADITTKSIINKVISMILVGFENFEDLAIVIINIIGQNRIQNTTTTHNLFFSRLLERLKLAGCAGLGSVLLESVLMIEFCVHITPHRWQKFASSASI